MGLEPAPGTPLPIASLQDWARTTIERFDIRLGSDQYQALLDAGDVIISSGDRQQYYRYIFALCLDRGKQGEIARIAASN